MKGNKRIMICKFCSMKSVCLYDDLGEVDPLSLEELEDLALALQDHARQLRACAAAGRPYWHGEGYPPDSGSSSP